MAAKNSKYAWMAFGSVCLMMTCWSGLVWNCMALYADPVIAEIGVTRTGFMFTITMFALTNAVLSMFFYGKVEEALGIRKMAIVGGLLSGCGLLMEAFMTGPVMMYIGAALIGSGVALTTNNTVATAVNHWFKSKNGTLISGAGLAGSLSGVVWALVIAALIAAVGWRTAFIISAIIVFAYAVVCSFLYKGNPEQLGVEPMYSDVTTEETGTEEVAEEEQIPFNSIFKTAQFWLLCSAALLGSLACVGVYSTLPLFAVDFGYPEAQGSVLSIALAATAITIIPLGMFADKAGTKWAVALTSICGVIALFMLRSTSIDLTMLYVVAALVGIAYFLIMAPLPVSVQEAFGSYEYSKKVGLIVSFSTLGCAFGGTLFNMFYDMLGNYDFGIMVFIVFTIYTAVALFFGTRRVHK